MVDDSIRESSYVVFVFERLFYYLQYISPACIFFGPQFRSNRKASSRRDKHAKIVQRSKRIEFYVVVWLLIEIIFTIASPNLNGWYLFLFLLPIWRYIDIFQVVINLSIFDHLRSDADGISIVSFERATLLTLWNYIELIILFGIAYSSQVLRFSFTNHLYAVGLQAFDPYYFSAITQLTIGYGDIQPLGIAKLVAVLQGLSGFLLALIVLSRLINLLPKLKPLFGEQSEERNTARGRDKKRR